MSQIVVAQAAKLGEILFVELDQEAHRGPQIFGPSLSCLLFQATLMMQPVPNRVDVTRRLAGSLCL